MTADRSITTACIVDDEELARRGVRSRLAARDDVRVVAECASGREAVDAVTEHGPDLVFLDVQMPGLDGFDVIEEIGPEQMPVVIFVTAYDEHALRAFDVHALDYLLKPIDEERLHDAIDRAKTQLDQRRSSTLGDRLDALLDAVASGEIAEAEAAGITERFVIKTGGRITFVEADAIDWVEAAGDYVRLHTSEKVHLLRETMGGMEERLDPDRFLRIHRSTIINTERLKELRPYGNSEYIVVLDDGTELKLSRTYRDALDDFLDGAL
ncbi:MAG: response regulator [Bacteroidetes bacterium]|jgi:two-component system LytT family response regulator|nr:response regulator [Bacteroidota bacterium]